MPAGCISAPRPRQPPQPWGLCVERGFSFLSKRPQPFSPGVSSSPASFALQTRDGLPALRQAGWVKEMGLDPTAAGAARRGTGRVGDPTENRPRQGASHSFRLHGPRTPG